MNKFVKNNILLLHVIVLLTSCVSTNLISQNELKTNNYKEVIPVNDQSKFNIDRFAMYPDGVQGIYRHISKTVVYPKSALQNNIEGTVLIEFVVEKNGEVKKAKIIKSVSNDIDKEALRVILSLKRFYPGIKNNKPIKLFYVQAINFKLI